MEIVIIGTGNTASVIGRMLAKAGNNIVQVFGRNVLHAEVLAEELFSKSCNTWEAINRQADFYIVAIADKALYELERHIQLTGQIMVHTAGAVSKNVLKNITRNYGVFYPLQSLRKDIPVMTEVPLLIDASNELTLKKISQLAHQISKQVSQVQDEKRLKLHVAAVCVNNFANHLYEVAEDFCKKENVDFSLLLPLALETAKRIESVSPRQALTGPAIRNDQVTIDAHLDILRLHPLFQKLYEQMTASIRAFHNG